ncbi:hypothetical protein ABVT39_024833 [Epinephelus coioides]
MQLPPPAVAHSLLPPPAVAYSLLPPPAVAHSLLPPPAVAHSLLPPPAVAYSLLPPPAVAGWDEMIKEVQDLKTSLQFSQKEVDELKEMGKELTNKNKEAHTDISAVCESVLTMNDKADYLEGQSKRNNIIIDGIPESPRETWEESEVKVREVLAVKLQMDEKRTELERAHRTGTNSGDRPRHIVVKVLRQYAKRGKNSSLP